ncbi:hypothetical protein BGZ47_004987 [Haplosporangium gracile]|nr:hypothetical protein BGZ47_004987 [Haplosporangium gracile]
MTSSPSLSPSPTSSPSSTSQLITLNVRASKDNIYPITLSPIDTVLHLKERVALALNTTSVRIRLVYSGRVLKDTHSIEDCKLVHGNVVHMVRSPLPATMTTTSAAVGAQTSIPFNSPTLSAAAPYAIPPIRQPSASAFSSPTRFNSTATPHILAAHSNRAHSGFGFGVDNGQRGQGMEAADMMGQMMQDPTFAQFMSSMLQNPQILESMVATNPVLQTMLGPDMRLILQSPQFRQMVSSPDALRQVVQMGTPPMAMAMQPPTTTTTANSTNSSSDNVGAHSTNPFSATTATSPPTTATSPMMIPHGMAGMRLPSSLIAANAPEKRFQVQLQQLSEMGFWDPTKNMRALQVTEGDVNSAIEILCSGV